MGSRSFGEHLLEVERMNEDDVQEITRLFDAGIQRRTVG